MVLGAPEFVLGIDLSSKQGCLSLEKLYSKKRKRPYIPYPLGILGCESPLSPTQWEIVMSGVSNISLPDIYDIQVLIY